MTPAAPVYWFDEIDSTSEEARRRAKGGDLSPVWIAARSQTAGRGRLGRSWQSPAGNLFATALMPLHAGLSEAAKLPFATGLAVIDACEPFVSDADLRLKWPNDVRVSGAKLSGILVESGEINGAHWAAIGIGVNVRTAPELEAETASLLSLGASPAIDAAHVLDALTGTLALRFEQAREDYPSVLRDWMTRAEGLGQTVRIGPKEQPVEGVFETLAEDGSIILRLPNGQTRLIRAGDVEIVKQVTL